MRRALPIEGHERPGAAELPGHGVSAGTVDADHSKSVRAWGLLAAGGPGCRCRAEVEQDAQGPAALLVQQEQRAKLALPELPTLGLALPGQVLQLEAQLVPLLALEPVGEPQYLVVLPEDSHVEPGSVALCQMQVVAATALAMGAARAHPSQLVLRQGLRLLESVAFQPPASQCDG